MEENRQEPRARAGDTFVIEFKKSGLQVPYSRATSHDLSCSGVSFIAMVQISPGAIVDMVFVLHPEFNDVKRLPLKGKVTRCSSSEGKMTRFIACEYVDLTPSHRQTIQNYLLWLLLRHRDGSFDSKLWRISTPGLFEVEFERNNHPWKAKGIELSVTECIFLTDQSFIKNENVMLRIKFSPNYPQNPDVLIKSLVRDVTTKPVYPGMFLIRCQFEHKLVTTRQAIQDFLEWLIRIR